MFSFSFLRTRNSSSVKLLLSSPFCVNRICDYYYYYHLAARHYLYGFRYFACALIFYFMFFLFLFPLNFSQSKFVVAFMLSSVCCGTQLLFRTVWESQMKQNTHICTPETGRTIGIPARIESTVWLTKEIRQKFQIQINQFVLAQMSNGSNSMLKRIVESDLFIIIFFFCGAFASLLHFFCV